LTASAGQSDRTDGLGLQAKLSVTTLFAVLTLTPYQRYTMAAEHYVGSTSRI
jgi:hypothetical protein